MVSLDEARAAGLSRYSTGKACINGHIADYFVSSRQCTVCAGERKKRWAANNHEHVAAYERKYTDANRAKKNAYNRQQQLKNPERAKANKARDYEKNKTKRQETMKRWREANPDKIRDLDRKKRQENPQLYSTMSRNYKIRKKKAQGSHTAEDIADIFKLQRGKCAICRAKLGKKYHVDHIVPLKAGGSNDRRNLQLTHATCNQSKQARDPIVFMQMRGMLL